MDDWKAYLGQISTSTSQPDDWKSYLGQTDQSIDPWSDFAQKATQIATQRGFPANVLLAQAANESAHGTAAPGNNYFGIKGQGTAGSNNLPSQEADPSGNYYNQNSDFAAYNSPEDSINAYIDLVSSYPGVNDAVASGDPDAVIKAIEAGGYATSPTYVQNIENTPEFQGGNQ